MMIYMMISMTICMMI